RSASVTVRAEMSNSSANSRAVGSFAPGGYVPSPIRSRITAMSWSLSGAIPSRLAIPLRYGADRNGSVRFRSLLFLSLRNFGRLAADTRTPRPGRGTGRTGLDRPAYREAGPTMTPDSRARLDALGTVLRAHGLTAWMTPDGLHVENPDADG